MTTYEIIMVVLTFLSLLIAADAKNRKKRAEPAFTSAAGWLGIEGSVHVGDFLQSPCVKMAD